MNTRGMSAAQATGLYEVYTLQPAACYPGGDLSGGRSVAEWRLTQTSRSTSNHREMPASMPDTRTAPWFSIHALKPYEGPEPEFYDPEAFPWVKEVEAAWPVIRRELDDWLSRQGTGTSYFRDGMVSGGEWRTIPLMTWGLEYHRTLEHFPQTMAVLGRIPGLVSVAFNTLEPGAEIKPHFGDTNAAVRAHLGLRVPGTLPELGMRVRGRNATWQEGRLLLFCDGYEHSAWNHTARPRQILLLDVLRPEFIDQRRRVCATVLGSLAVQALLQKLARMSLPVLRVPLYLIHLGARLSATALGPVYNAIGRWKHRK